MTATQFRYAVWNRSECLNEDLARSLEIFYGRIPHVRQSGHRLDVMSDIDQLLARAEQTYTEDWVCVLGMGVLFPDQERITALVEQALSEIREPVLVMGHLVHKSDRYCGLHEQLLLVHLPTYRKMGRPAFGDYGSQRKELQNFLAGPSVRSDGYTPRYIVAQPGRDTYKIWNCGWGFVDASLRADLPIFNLPEELRFEKIFAFPEDETDTLNHNLAALYNIEDPESWEQRRFLAFLFNRRLGLKPKTGRTTADLQGREGTVFLFNTEPLLHHAKSPGLESLEQYFGPCAGFADLAILFTYGFDEKTQITYFDVNERSLHYRRRLWQEFDGHLHSLPKLFHKWFAESPQQPFYWGEAGLGGMDEEIQKLRAVFGTDDAFFATWQRVKKLNHVFRACNLITENAKLLAQIKPQQRSLLWMSDIFTGFNELTYGYRKIHQHYSDFQRRACQCPELWVTGTDLNNHAVTIRAQDWADAERVAT